MSGGLSSYQSVNNYSALNEATPHKVTQVMLEALEARIAEADGHIQRGEIQDKGVKIGKALALVEGLVMSLDPDRGGEIAANLQRLYEYVSHILLRANLESRSEYLTEAAALVREIRSGWESIAQASTP
jgi:flagellar protein FliS